MASDNDKIVAIRRFLKRTKSPSEIQAIAVDAFAKMQDGVTVTSLSFEGGSTGAQINCNPELLLSACEDVLVELGVSKPALTTIFPKFSGQMIET